MSEDHDSQEVILHPELSQSQSIQIAHVVCPSCEEGADAINRARADVIRFQGHMISLMMPLVIILTFANAVLNHESWKPDATIITAMLAGIGYIGVFAWKTRRKE